MITLARASALMATAATAAAVVTVLRVPAQGGWTTARLHLAPAASQATPGSGSVASNRGDQGGSAGLPRGGFPGAALCPQTPHGDCPSHPAPPTTAR